MADIFSSQRKTPPRILKLFLQQSKVTRDCSQNIFIPLDILHPENPSRSSQKELQKLAQQQR